MKVLPFILFIVLNYTYATSTHELPLDMNFHEYHRYFSQLKKTKGFVIKDQNITKAIDGGEKLYQWIEKINSLRNPEQKIQLTSKDTQRGIPIEKPSEYGPATIKKDLAELLNDLPTQMSDIIFGKEIILTTHSLKNDEEFIMWGRKVSKLYQSAVRWSGMQGSLDYYAARKLKDVRGFYYLQQINNLDSYLLNIDSESDSIQNEIRQALLGLCLNNSQLLKTCNKNLEKAFRTANLIEFKDRYWKLAKYNWDSFFIISDPRKDVVWKSTSPGIMEVVFKDPQNQKIAEWLEENIEDEFRLIEKGWALDLHFISGGWSTAYVEFKKNTTPHVSGGNKIVMDANIDRDEYGVRWTIRHEFGHILRLPDCYHEFYDRERHLMVNYQLDVNDLMCSRKGTMNLRIYEELKRVYFNSSKLWK